MSESAISPTLARTRSLATASLIAALMAATSWIAIPLGPVPVTLQVAFVFLAALLLRPGWAASSMALYVALGAAGLPVFSGAQGGLGVIAGPTGGFIVGFIVAAAAGSAVRESIAGRASSVSADVTALLVTGVVIYTIGLPWLSVVAGIDLSQAIAVGMLPFLLPDLAKAALAFATARGVRMARRAE